MKTGFLVASAAVLGLASAPVSAQEDTDLSPTATADDQCGWDRRCRIDRMKRRNRARRRAATLAEERALQRELAAQQEKRIDRIPRLRSPIGIDLFLRTSGGTGISAGYTFFGALRAEISYISNYIYFFDYDNTSDTYTDGSVDLGVVTGRLLYFVRKSWLSPYFSAGFSHGSGDYYGYGFNDTGEGGDVKELRATHHALEIGVGIDTQFFSKSLRGGFHGRIGVAYRPLLYNQARVGPGMYDDMVRQNLASRHKSERRLDMVILLGWAF